MFSCLRLVTALLNARENADLVERVFLLFLREFHQANLLEGVELAVTQPAGVHLALGLYL